MTAVGLGTDIGLLLVGMVVAIGGWRRGALVGASSLAGFIFGLWIGGRILPVVLKWMSRQDWSVADHTTVVALIVFLGCAVILQSLGYAISGAIRRRLGDGVVRGVDSVGGALISLVAVAAVIWLAAGFVRTTSLMSVNRAVADSRIVSGIDRAAPVSSSQALGSISHFLQRNGFPRVFSGQSEDVKTVGAPKSSVPKAVLSKSGSVVRVVTTAPSCNSGSEGSGWVTTKNRVVTNAHVVAGSSRITVKPRGAQRPRTAKLIAFDPARDVAVLQVKGLQADALKTTQSLERGDSAVAAGYPGNGPFTLSPARVRRPVSARGLDIYGQHASRRDIYSLRTTVRSGNSGGPLLDDKGRVAGMVFARSQAHSDTGYALALDEVRPVLKTSASGRVVGSGKCLQKGDS